MQSYFFRHYGTPVPNNTKFYAIPFKARYEGKLREAAEGIVKNADKIKGAHIADIRESLRSIFPMPQQGSDFMINSYKPKEVDRWQRQLIGDWQDQVFKSSWKAEEFPLDGPLSVQYWIFMERPASVNTMYPDKKPDEDNIIKVVQDSLEATELTVKRRKLTVTPVIVNDSRIVEKRTSMRWAWMPYPDCGAQAPGIAVMITALDQAIRRDLNRAYKLLADKMQGLNDHALTQENILQDRMEKDLVGWQYGEVPAGQLELIK